MKPLPKVRNRRDVEAIVEEAALKIVKSGDWNDLLTVEGPLQGVVRRRVEEIKKTLEDRRN